MHRDERLLGARTQLVQRLRDEFLARAAFAQNQNRRPRRRHLLHDIENFFHHRRFADDVSQAEFGIELLTQRNVFHFERLLFQRAGDAHFQFINLQTAFRNVVIRAVFHRVHREFFGTVSGHQDADRRLRQRLCPRN